MEKHEQELELNNFKISKSVLELIAGLETIEVEGVAGLSGTVVEGIKDWFTKKQQSKGVKVLIEDDVLSIILHVTLDYGYVISEVARKIQTNVKDTLETMMGIKVKNVDVFIDNINFSK
ncbi:Asp23/Gls24 family envelope stress response protein [Candidatus Oleimmundimicrobium sp.]|uniref:Asp23/Gls24 family envelope stress response protein n=1 Tax=Candidatus Oleimmundimicrobium sp. TaxID=3060597 RepID=UPI0027277682|nr:Asp23/Gls24 family envelope stress response protein [Candidatus Oleimmundimicrobium sp.]MDO8886518.1 Asp23/Gls24 family envelope stress response protein [Candidatus Oleimmundimicrobium sp.]